VETHVCIVFEFCIAIWVLSFVAEVGEAFPAAEMMLFAF
jgi:hypothetical protein